MKSNHSPKITRPLRGFTLLEILVALVILSIGLLGLAGLHVSSMRGNNGSYLRAQATLIANDIAARMYANAIDVDANGYATVNWATICNAPPNPACDDVTAACDTAEITTYDAFVAQCENALALPSGAVNIVCIDSDAGSGTPDGDLCTNGSPHTITVAWTEMTPTGQADKNVVMTIVP